MAIRVGTGRSGLTGSWSSRRTLARDQALFGYVQLLPACLLIVILVGVPFLRALWLSFHKKLLGVEEAPWIGLGNYSALLSDPTFWLAFKNTVIFTTGSIACKLILGLAIALVLNEALPRSDL
jgi:ABC-type sugar transport system permease subunit